MKEKCNLPVGIGIIGLGMVSEAYLRSYHQDVRTKIIGVADVNERLREKAKASYGIEIATKDYKELIGRDDIDVIIVATPHYLHHPMVIDSFRSGKHVICEKPLSLNTKEACEMIEAANVAEKHLFIGLNMRVISAFRTVQSIIEEGKIGRPFMAKIAYMGHEVERMGDPASWKGTKDKAGGGVLLDGGYHVIDIMNMFFGYPKKIQSVCGKCVIKTANKSEDNAILIMEYPNGLICEVSASFTTKLEGSRQSPTLGMRLEVYGSEGSIWTQYRSNISSGWQTTLISDDKETQIPVRQFLPDNLALHFIDCLVDGVKPIVTPEDALRVQKIVDEVYNDTQMNQKNSNIVKELTGKHEKNTRRVADVFSN